MGLEKFVGIFSNIWRSIVAVSGKNPGFYGEGHLWRKLRRISNENDTVVLFNDGVQVNEQFYEMDLLILRFVSKRGLPVDLKMIQKSSVVLRNFIKQSNHDIDKDYYKAYALHLLTTYGSIFCNVMVAFKIIMLWDSNSMLAIIMSAAWLIPNTYFVTQLFIYHLSALETIRIKHVFEEATPEDISRIMCKDKAPLALSVVPAYMEDFRLIRNSLYCHALQRYPNRKIVLLLGNEYYTSNEEVLKNTMDNMLVIHNIQDEFCKNDAYIKTELERFHYTRASDNFKEVLTTLARLYNFSVVWFEAKLYELQADIDDYPTKNFLLRHTFKDQIHYYKNRKWECESLSNTIALLSEVDIRNRVELYISECNSVFNIDLTVFQRYKYLNAEHERTKAGNLTAYLTLLGKKWNERETDDGKFIVEIEETTDVCSETYVGVFDTDTIAKPDYLIRKVSFLEKEENSRVGLIQSPYNVPVPEPTIPASASGIHSHWFLPISIGMSEFNSAFWLGFNGLFRAKAILSIKGSFIAETLIEDLENSLKILKSNYTIVTSPEYQCQTFSPPDMHGMQVQRQRWASGGFRIGLNYVKDSLQGQFGSASFLEWILRLNYILGLNILPLIVTATILLECPFYNVLFGVETIPFFFYILTYYFCLKRTSYSLRQYFDGLAASLFMNFHYLRGTWTSFGVLFRKESSQIFKSTPRSKNMFQKSFGRFEILGICFLIPFMISKIVVSFSERHFWDVYPVYTLMCILYGLVRLVGKSEAIKDVR